MRKEIRFLAIIMIVFMTFSLALAGPATMVAQSNIADPQFVAEMDGVQANIDLSVTYFAVQPSFNYEELTNELSIIEAPGHVDVRNDVLIASCDFSVLKYPTYMLMSESHNHKNSSHTHVLISAALKQEDFWLPKPET